MFGWTTTIIWVGTWVCALGFWLFKKKPLFADVLLGTFIALPFAFFTVIVNLNFMVKSPGEVFPVLMVISILASGPLALLFGWLAAQCKTLEGNLRWMLVFGAVTGGAVGIIHLWMFLSRTTSIDTQAEWWMFSVTDGLIGTLLFGTVIKGQASLTKKQIATHCVIPAITLLIAAYLLPEVAFRTSGYRQSYSGLETVGAKRLSKGDNWVAGEADRALARSGDESKVSLLIEDVRSGNPSLGVNGSIQILSNRYSNRPEVQNALIELLESKSTVVHRSGSEYKQHQILLELIDASEKMKREETVQPLIRIYKGDLQDTTVQVECSNALAAIGGKEASEFARSELKKEPPINPAVAEALMRVPGALEGAASYKETVAKRNRIRNLRSARIEQLVASHESEELYRRAMDKDSGDRGQAAVGLIKLKDPRREEVLLNTAFPAHGWARELRGFSDPELAKAISSRILKSNPVDQHLARFLCDWSPPESSGAARYLVRKVSFGPAVTCLIRIGAPSSHSFLANQLRQNLNGTLALLICGYLSNAPSSASIPALEAAMSAEERHPRLLFNVRELYLSDVAALGLMKSSDAKVQSRARSYVFKGSRESAEEYVAMCADQLRR